VNTLEPGGIYRDPDTREWIVAAPWESGGMYFTLEDPELTLTEVRAWRDMKKAEHDRREADERAAARALLRLERVPEDAVDDAPIPAPAPEPVRPPAKRSGRWRRK